MSPGACPAGWEAGAAFWSLRTTRERPSSLCLATKGYQIDLVINGTERLNRARMSEYAVMIIDRMLFSTT
jgi:hypothetical protein